MISGITWLPPLKLHHRPFFLPVKPATYATQYDKAHQTNMKLKDEVTNLLHHLYIYIYTIVIWENLEQVSHSHASKNHSLFDSHLIVTPPLHAAPNSPNSPSATRRRKDLQVKGILLQMLARPQGQTVHQHDRRYQMYSPYMTVGQQGPLHHTNEKIALSRSLYATLISDYQTQFTTLIRLKGVFTTKKTLRVLAEKQQSPTGL